MKRRGILGILFFTSVAFGSGGDGGGNLDEIRVDSIGEQKTLVILVKPSNTSPPYTRETAEATVFTHPRSLNAWVQDNSYGKTWLTGKVIDWLTVPEAKDCPQDFREKIFLAADARGVDFRQYTRVIIPGDLIGCPGFSESVGLVPVTTPDGPVRMSIAYPYSLKNPESAALRHEFGHILGALHSHRFHCGTQQISNNCTFVGYGDPYDVMGSSIFGHLNGFQLERLGWLGTNETQEVLSSGLFSLSPIESFSGFRRLKIPLEKDSNGNTTLWYLIEQRSPMGFDTGFPGPGLASPFGGVLVSVGPWPRNDYVLDMHPTSQNRSDGFIDPLKVNDSFVDSVRGIRITPKEVTNHHSLIQIERTSPQTDNSPQIQVLSPLPGSNVFGKVPFKMDVRDERGIRSLDLYQWIEGRAYTLGAFDSREGQAPTSVYTWTWDSKDERDGEHVFEVQAVDTSFHKSVYQWKVNLTNQQNDHAPPQVWIVEPEASQVISGVRSLVADARDNEDQIITVGFYLQHLSTQNKTYIAYEYFPTSSIRWETDRDRNKNPVFDGLYDLVAYGRDRAGNIGTSKPLRVLIQNGIMPSTPSRFLRGDANSDGKVDISDAQIILNYLFDQSEHPILLPCTDAADANDDGRIDTSDPTWILNFLFQGGSPPKPPYPNPGIDLTSDSLYCL